MILLNDVVLIVFVAIIHVSTGGQFMNMEDFKPPGFDECLSTTGLTAEDVVNESFSINKMCFIKCVLEENGIITETGELKPDNLDEVPVPAPLPEETLRDLKQCMSKMNRIERCEDMMQFMQCA
nr:odorant binding protein 22 [Aromia bungii]